MHYSARQLELIKLAISFSFPRINSTLLACLRRQVAREDVARPFPVFPRVWFKGSMLKGDQREGFVSRRVWLKRSNVLRDLDVVPPDIIPIPTNTKERETSRFLETIFLHLRSNGKKSHEWERAEIHFSRGRFHIWRISKIIVSNALNKERAVYKFGGSLGKFAWMGEEGWSGISAKWLVRFPVSDLRRREMSFHPLRYYSHVNN